MLLLAHHHWGTFCKERKGKSVTQQQNFYTDEVKSVWNPVISADWTMELLCRFSYYLRMKNVNRCTMNLWESNQSLWNYSSLDQKKHYLSFDVAKYHLGKVKSKQMLPAVFLICNVWPLGRPPGVLQGFKVHCFTSAVLSADLCGSKSLYIANDWGFLLGFIVFYCPLFLQESLSLK